ncbi:phenylalanine--tRNA ligase subunit alpha [Candidatus Woesearchaeota archaeon]|nr:phenylalanine--tRNA ligase subunit alpha [Candidatus Woesearchaeota archaeon]
MQSAFWDLDALFVPQDHPAREMQDTFYLEGKAKLPTLWEKIKETHENGGDTKSTGWKYKFSKEEAEKVLLRTHMTVLSARKLAQLKKEDLPVKLFAVNRVFRNEALDWKHLFEFYQVEGIVVDPRANLQHLKGYLREFYLKMGYTDVKMTPSHFPYTEPSLEVSVFHPVKKEWVELGGAGIFRPEVVVPLLGFDCPVLAWGQGMGRIIGEYWKLQDIRDLYKNDLKQLREIKMWMK